MIFFPLFTPGALPFPAQKFRMSASSLFGLLVNAIFAKSRRATAGEGQGKKKKKKRVEIQRLAASCTWLHQHLRPDVIQQLTPQ